MGMVSTQGDSLSKPESPSITQAHEPPTLELVVDSGAGLHLFQTATMRAAARELAPREADGFVSGIGGRSHITTELGVRLSLEGGVHIDLHAPFVETHVRGGAARDIISTAVLDDELGFTTHLVREGGEGKRWWVELSCRLFPRVPRSPPSADFLWISESWVLISHQALHPIGRH